MPVSSTGEALQVPGWYAILAGLQQAPLCSVLCALRAVLCVCGFAHLLSGLTTPCAGLPSVSFSNQPPLHARTHARTDQPSSSACHHSAASCMHDTRRASHCGRQAPRRACTYACMQAATRLQLNGRPCGAAQPACWTIQMPWHGMHAGACLLSIELSAVASPLPRSVSSAHTTAFEPRRCPQVQMQHLSLYIQAPPAHHRLTASNQSSA